MEIKLHKKYQEVQEGHWWFRVRDNILNDIAQKYFKIGDKVLDYGCNYGHSVRILKNSGFKAEGIDISNEAIEYGRSIGISSIFLDREKLYGPESFDNAIVLDVLEHIEDDQKALERISSLVKPGGTIVITVPAYGFLWGIQDEISEHFRRYTMNELIDLSLKSGNFDILEKSYFNTILFLPIAFLRISSRLLNIKNRESDLDINNLFLNRILFSIFDLERKLLNYMNFPFGVSIFLVLKRR